MTFHVPEGSRIRSGVMGSDASYGNNGAFFIRVRPGRVGGTVLRVIASDGGGADGTKWEHVSVSLPDRCPTWDDMCAVKAKFWDEEDLVVQYHPPRSEFVNCHPHCLHLWRPVGIVVPRPSVWWMV